MLVCVEQGAEGCAKLQAQKSPFWFGDWLAEGEM